jgi:hypothetical protein
MKRVPTAVLVLSLAAAAASLGAAAAADRGSPDALNRAKTLTFDRRYAEAREAWRAAHAGGGGDRALYWIARCSESLGEKARALDEYGRYLNARPSDPTLTEEALTSRVALATELHQSGRKEFLPVAVSALASRSRTVRYFAALRLSSLGPAGRPAVPVLVEIVTQEQDRDLVERATLALLRLDARALPKAAASPPSRRGAPPAWIRVRIFERGEAQAGVKVDLPLVLAELLFKSLPDDAQLDLKARGFDARGFLAQLKDLGPAQIVSIKGNDGGRVQVWIE